MPCEVVRGCLVDCLILWLESTRACFYFFFMFVWLDFCLCVVVVWFFAYLLLLLLFWVICCCYWLVVVGTWFVFGSIGRFLVCLVVFCLFVWMDLFCFVCLFD